MTSNYHAAYWSADFSPLEYPNRPSGLKIRGPVHAKLLPACR
jgi:hypothetical protein